VQAPTSRSIMPMEEMLNTKQVHLQMRIWEEESNLLRSELVDNWRVFQNKFHLLCASTSEANQEFKASLIITMVEDVLSGDFSELAGACTPELISVEPFLANAHLLEETIESTVLGKECQHWTLDTVDLGLREDEEHAKKLLSHARSRIFVHFSWGIMNIFAEHCFSITLL